MTTAAQRWTAALAEWALPERILTAAPEPPWGFCPDVFVDLTARAMSGPPSPTHRLVREALPPGGVLLDVGAGAGAASLPACPPARRLVAVDQDQRMLTALCELATDRVDVQTVVGRWPDVADDAGVADVVVCANVAYNVPDLAPFVAALTRAARQRVVLELSAVHPQSALNPLWRRFWDLDRPDRPTAADAEDVVRETVPGPVGRQDWTAERSILGRDDAAVARIRRRLCLPASADQELAAALAELPMPTETRMVALWWPGGVSGW